ncbi:hypothetical protein Tco_0745959 [Tanacetum coccineum]
MNPDSVDKNDPKDVQLQDEDIMYDIDLYFVKALYVDELENLLDDFMLSLNTEIDEGSIEEVTEFGVRFIRDEDILQLKLNEYSTSLVTHNLFQETLYRPYVLKESRDYVYNHLLYVLPPSAPMPGGKGIRKSNTCSSFKIIELLSHLYVCVIICSTFYHHLLQCQL